MPPKRDKKGFAVLFLQPQRVAWTLMTFVPRDWGNRAGKNLRIQPQQQKRYSFFWEPLRACRNKKKIAIPIWILYIQHTTKTQDGGFPSPPPKKPLLLGIAISRIQNSNFPRNPWRTHLFSFVWEKRRSCPSRSLLKRGSSRLTQQQQKAKSSPSTLPPLVCSI